ncbi:MAG: hypothetical protein LBU53_08385 [Zoogloeaceae bacterium]|nr:hypothetical protein [Zoogloeaceae bacterium]
MSYDYLIKNGALREKRNTVGCVTFSGTRHAKLDKRKQPPSGLRAAEEAKKGKNEVRLKRQRKRNSGLQVCRFAGLQVCRFAGLQVCRFAGLQVCRFAGLQGSVPYSWLKVYQNQRVV